jgi:RNA polymerase sigma factor (sigma-70 family)
MAGEVGAGRSEARGHEAGSYEAGRCEQDGTWDVGAAVAHARRGEEAAWEALVAQYSGVLRWVAVRHGLTEHEAQDVVQTTWMRCVENIAALRDPQCLPAWLLTTCRRESLRWLRAKQRWIPQDSTDTSSSIAAAVDPAAGPYDQVARWDETAHLYAAIDELAPRQRSVLLELLGRRADGETGTVYHVASRRLGMPVGSLGPTRCRAMQRLRTNPRLRVVG